MTLNSVTLCISKGGWKEELLVSLMEEYDFNDYTGISPWIKLDQQHGHMDCIALNDSA